MSIFACLRQCVLIQQISMEWPPCLKCCCISFFAALATKTSSGKKGFLQLTVRDLFHRGGEGMIEEVVIWSHFIGSQEPESDQGVGLKHKPFLQKCSNSKRFHSLPSKATSILMFKHMSLHGTFHSQTTTAVLDI